jgi:hypothetical protein
MRRSAPALLTIKYIVEWNFRPALPSRIAGCSGIQRHSGWGWSVRHSQPVALCLSNRDTILESQSTARANVYSWIDDALRPHISCLIFRVDWISRAICPVATGPRSARDPALESEAVAAVEGGLARNRFLSPSGETDRERGDSSNANLPIFHAHFALVNRPSTPH